MDAIKLPSNQGGHDVVATLSDVQRNVAMPIPSVFDVDVCDFWFWRVHQWICVSEDCLMTLEWLVQPPGLPTFQSDTREFWRKGHDQRCCSRVLEIPALERPIVGHQVGFCFETSR